MRLVQSSSTNWLLRYSRYRIGIGLKLCGNLRRFWNRGGEPDKALDLLKQALQQQTPVADALGN